MGGFGYSVPTDWAGIVRENFRCCATSLVERAKSGLEAVGSPANWRCTALEKFGRVKLLDVAWRTAPRHSRPACCVIDADMDAEDYPERDPQNGQ
jgi:hypothetical protein